MALRKYLLSIVPLVSSQVKKIDFTPRGVLVSFPLRSLFCLLCHGFLCLLLPTHISALSSLFWTVCIPLILCVGVLVFSCFHKTWNNDFVSCSLLVLGNAKEEKGKTKTLSYYVRMCSYFTISQCLLYIRFY